MFFRFIRQSDGEVGRERERNPFCRWFTHQMAVTARTGPGRKLEPGATSGSLTCIAGAQVLLPSSVFSGILTGSCMRSGAAS